MTSNLTSKQERFAQKYIETGNASEAYRQAYDAENMAPETIHNEAHVLLKNHEVAARVARLEELTRKRHEVTVDRVIAEYAKLAFLDVRKAFDDDGSLKPIQEMDDDTAAAISSLEYEMLHQRGEADEELESHAHGGTLKRRRAVIGRVARIKLADKKGALDSIARHLGMFNDSLELKGRLALTHEQVLEQLDNDDDAAREGTAAAPS